jgi:hypothetical protein
LDLQVDWVDELAPQLVKRFRFFLKSIFCNAPPPIDVIDFRFHLTHLHHIGIKVYSKSALFIHMTQSDFSSASTT